MKYTKMMEQRGKILFLVALLLLVFSGCGNSRAGLIEMQEGSYYSPNAQEQDTGEDGETDVENEDTNVVQTSSQDSYYMILQHDLQNYQMILMNLSNGQQAQYEYTEGTEFFDKYGQYTQESQFVAGSLIQVQRFNRNETLGAVAYTDDTWAVGNVRDLEVQQEKNAMTFGGKYYTYDQTMLKVFSNGEQITLYDIGEEDVLKVYGIGKQVYSIVVDTGHGTLQLTNTALFEGGWLNLGTQVYAMVTKNMSMDVPEGTYELSVANNGYGDSGEILIRRGKVTTIDLNDYKGEGPKMGKLLFHIGVDGAKVYVDGEKVDASSPLELSYGVHNVSVVAAGYDTWTKQLVVNSPKTNVDIAVSDASDTGSSSGSSSSNSSSNTSSKSGSNSSSGKKSTGSSSDDSSDGSTSSNAGSGSVAGSKAGSLAGSHSGSSSSSSGSNSSSLANAAMDSSIANILTGGDSSDYLDTLTDLLDSLERLQSNSSSGTDED